MCMEVKGWDLLDLGHNKNINISKLFRRYYE
jgi:hypothetical protein